jgi:predicted transcriptional regulator
MSRSAVTGGKFLAVPCPLCGTTNVIVSGQWLRARREHAGLSQKAMAMRLLIAPSYVCDIEHDRRHCPIEIRKAYEALR